MLHKNGKVGVASDEMGVMSHYCLLQVVSQQQPRCQVK